MFFVLDKIKKGLFDALGIDQPFETEGFLLIFSFCCLWLQPQQQNAMHVEFRW